MKNLSVDAARDLVLKSDGDCPLKGTGKDEHCFAVGAAARKIAEKMGLDGEKAEVLGTLHDVGCKFARGDQHPIRGYKYLKSLGVPEDAASPTLTHSFINGDPNCTADGILIAEGHAVPKQKIIPYGADKESETDRKFLLDYLEKHIYSDYEKIINLCDLLATNRVIGLENRLAELLESKSQSPDFVQNPAHSVAARKLQSEIESKMRCKISDLFPEIATYNKSADTYRASLSQSRKDSRTK
jgi:hypothetical protein